MIKKNNSCAIIPLVVSMTFFPSATALLAASTASPAARDTFDSSLSKASIAAFFVLEAVDKMIFVFTYSFVKEKYTSRKTFVMTCI